MLRAVARAPVVAAIGAPSDLAVEVAEQAGITLVGFLRETGFNVYTHGARVATPAGVAA
jgi:FdhD protein